jgi:hypothetical protein
MPQGLEEPMWAAFRSLADLIASAKKTFPFVGTLLLIFLTVLLIVLQLYLSAAFAGVLAAGALCAYLVQTLRERKDERERERKNLLKAEKLAQKAGARGKKINKAKAAVTDAAKGVGRATADVAKMTYTRVRIPGRLRFWRSKNRTK